jgi:hypothetical protein
LVAIAAILLAFAVAAFFGAPEPARSGLVLPVCINGAIAFAVAGLIATLFRR